MNIFVLDKDIEKSAKAHCNPHVVKMPLETAQLLCTARHELGESADTIPYRKTHVNHPCSIWARESLYNYVWLCRFGVALCKEYTHRYGKVHSCQHTLEHAKMIFPPSNGEVTPFARAMPDEFKYDTSIDTITAYKRYIASKPWASSNYLRDPSRKPHWL